MAINVSVKPNGPYVISGDLAQVQVQDGNGNSFDISGKPAIALCRCGASANKPFCDGAHGKIGFQAAEAVAGK